jgi:FKBP-type peptidyl-prolyl cis-trans isomerase
MKKRSVLSFSFTVIAIMLWLTGCEQASWDKQEQQQIDNYIKSLGDTIYELKPSGLYYIELKTGTGAFPVDRDTVTFYAKGCLLDNTVYTTNYKESSPYKYVMGSALTTGEILSGLDEGMRYMKAGGIARFVLPSSLAWGKYGYGFASPGYTPVYYEVKLISVKPGPK